MLHVTSLPASCTDRQEGYSRGCNGAAAFLAETALETEQGRHLNQKYNALHCFPKEGTEELLKCSADRRLHGIAFLPVLQRVARNVSMRSEAQQMML